jgi:hypothetical protein
MPLMPDALAGAARLLLAEASPATVRQVLRLLLDDVPARSNKMLDGNAKARPSAAAVFRNSEQLPRRKRKAARPADPAWEALRQQVRTAMLDRSLDFAGLGAALSRTAATTECMVSSRRAPGSATQAALRAWLTEAPAVASPAAPFRGGRAKPRANGTATTADT